MLWTILVLCVLVRKCGSVIHHLNATEHGRMPALFALDDYNGCLQRGGTYCLARLNLFADPSNSLFKQIKDYSAYTAKHYNYTFVDRGVCFDATCPKFLQGKNISNDIELRQSLEECLNKSIWEGYGLQSTVSNVFSCDRNVIGLNTNLLDWIVLGIFLILVTINVLGSLYDLLLIKKEPEKLITNIGNEYLLSFSIIRNWYWMGTWKLEDPKLDDLRVFNGIRTVLTLCVLLAHAMFVTANGFSENPHDFEKAYENTYYQVIFNGLAIVQIFFVISGFLFIFNLQYANDRVNWTSIPKIVFCRWYRLSPSYAVLLAFNMTWLRYLGSGPAWSLFVTSSVVADCRKYWWLHLLYINNFQPDDKLCALQTWHIAADMQLFLIGLLVYFATQQGGRALALGLLLLVGMVAPALHVWLQDLDGQVHLTPETFRSINNKTFSLMHIRGYNNLAGYVTGMAICYWFHDMKKKNFEFRKYQFIRYATWLVIPLLLALFHTGCMFYVDGDRASLAVRMAYAATHRLMIAAVAGFGILAILTKCSDTLRGLSAWRGWLIPAKLSYAVYLLHMDIVYITIGYRRQLLHVSFLNMILTYLGVVVLSFVAALPFYLLVEAPMSRLIKVALNHISKRNKAKMI